jgi:hypothetical protein
LQTLNKCCTKFLYKGSDWLSSFSEYPHKEVSSKMNAAIANFVVVYAALATSI